MKTCSKCQIEKDLSLFTYRKDREKYYTVCNCCRSIRRREYYIENKVLLDNTVSNWIRLNPEKHKEHYTKYQAKPSSKQREQEWYIKNRPHILKAKQEWYINNKSESFANAAKRRAIKLNATLDLPKDQNKLIGEFYKESRRLTNETGVKYHVDHIIPLQGKTVSGLHVPWNLQVITAVENFKKSNKLVSV